MTAKQLHQPAKRSPLSVSYRFHQTSHSQSPWLKAVKECMIQHLGDLQFTVSDLASELHYSERQFFRKMKKLSGLTPNEFIRNLRLEKAKELLLSGQYSTLKQIAYRVGYLRTDYFSKLFKAQYQVSPVDFLIK